MEKTLSKDQIISKLKTTLTDMNNIFPLSSLCEKIESETGGKFTFLTFRELLDKFYPDIKQSNKIFLLKHTPFKMFGVSYSNPLMKVLPLFTFFSKILKEPIISPSLSFYRIADILDKQFQISTLNFIFSLELSPSSEIDLSEFYSKISKRLKIDNVDSICIFKGIDYKKRGKIKIEDFILVIDSYRDFVLPKEILDNEKTEEAFKCAQLLKNFLDKNFISVDTLFENSKYNYLTQEELKERIKREVNLSQKILFENEGREAKLDDEIIDNVLNCVSRAGKIMKDDFIKYLPQNVKVKNKIGKLNESQCYWLNKYIDALSSVGITPKMAFESAMHANQTEKIINLEDLKRQIKILLPNGQITAVEANNIMDALDINKSRQIAFDDYNAIFNQIENLKKKVSNVKDLKEKKNGVYNVWYQGIKSTNYFLLPVKGNMNIILKVAKDLEKNMSLYSQKQNDKDEISEKDESGFNEFKEEDQMGADQGAVMTDDEGRKLYVNVPLEIKGEDEKSKKNKSKGQVSRISDELDTDTRDEFLLIQSLENFQCENLFFPCFDLLNYLVINNSLTKDVIGKSIRALDRDKDGFISILDLITLLLHRFKHRSTRLTFKYLYLKIYNEFKLESTDDFFIKNNIDIYNEILINDLCNLLSKLSIEQPISKKIHDELKRIFPSPITYKHLGDMIDECKSNAELSKTIGKSFGELIDLTGLEEGIRKIVNNLIDDSEYIQNDYLKAKSFRENIKTFLSKSPPVMNLTQYNLTFVKPLQINPSIALAIFQLLKSISSNEEQLISQSDLIAFLESYITTSEDEQKNEEQSNYINDIITLIESKGPPLKYAFESIPFCRTGIISICELGKYLKKFYPSTLNTKNYMTILNEIDEKKIGMVNYGKLQLFLYEYSGNGNNNDRNKFSFKLEFEFIASEIIKLKQYKTANDYFSIEEFQSVVYNYNCVSKEEHKILLKDVCSSNRNRDALYEFLCQRGGNAKGYNIQFLYDYINGLLAEKEKTEEIEEDAEDDNKLDELPDKRTVSNVMLDMGIGDDGKIAINEFIMKFDVKYRKALINKMDKKKKGIIDFPQLIDSLRNLYGNDINLNYKLCAQYTYKKFIKDPKKIDDFILTKVDILSSNIKEIYISHDVTYNTFIDCFANDKFLFEYFYTIYKEKKGSKSRLINLSSIAKFIRLNNIEAIGYQSKQMESEEEKSINNSSMRESNDEDNNPKKKIKKENISIKIQSILDERGTTILDIIKMIKPSKGDMNKNYGIKEQYMSTLLGAELNIDEDDIKIILDYFRLETGRFNLKKFFEFDRNLIEQRSVYLSSEILPKIKEHIKNSNYKSFRVYLKNNFLKEYLDINETIKICNKYYGFQLFQCMIILKGEIFFFPEKFFTENNLKDLFKSSEYSLTLKLAVKRLSEYFDKNKDKLKVFKQFDTDKNGYISNEEFITALNKLKDLELNDSQKYELLKIADKDKNGKIEPKEFLAFIKTVKNIDKENMNDNSHSPILPQLARSKMS